MTNNSFISKNQDKVNLFCSATTRQIYCNSTESSIQLEGMDGWKNWNDDMEEILFVPDSMKF